MTWVTMSLTVREQLQWPVQSEYTLPEESPYNNKSLAEIMHAGYALSEHTIIPSHFHHLYYSIHTYSGITLIIITIVISKCTAHNVWGIIRTVISVIKYRFTVILIHHKQGLSPCAEKYPPPHTHTHTHCVPSDSASQGATVCVCPLCCTWFGYYE